MREIRKTRQQTGFQSEYTMNEQQHVPALANEGVMRGNTRRRWYILVLIIKRRSTQWINIKKRNLFTTLGKANKRMQQQQQQQQQTDAKRKTSVANLHSDDTIEVETKTME